MRKYTFHSIHISAWGFESGVEEKTPLSTAIAISSRNTNLDGQKWCLSPEYSPPSPPDTGAFHREFRVDGKMDVIVREGIVSGQLRARVRVANGPAFSEAVSSESGGELGGFFRARLVGGLGGGISI